MANLERTVRTAGITLLAICLGSVTLLLMSPFDTGQSGVAIGAFAAVAWLEVVWVFVAGILATLRWRALPTSSRVVLVCNAPVVCMLLADYFFHRG